MLAACDRKVVGRFAAAADGLLGIVDERTGIERRVGVTAETSRDPGPPASAPASATACTPS